MKELIFISFVFLSTSVMAQQPQIAVVSTNGNTKIFIDAKAAIASAQDDDFVYLPGGTLNFDSLNFNKRIHVIGTGHNPDSAAATGKTIFTGNVYVLANSNSADLQGVDVYGRVISYQDGGVFTISKCMVRDGIECAVKDNNTIGTFNVSECIFGVYCHSFSDNNKIQLRVNRSIFDKRPAFCKSGAFDNCIFLNSIETDDWAYQCENLVYRNCIFFNNGKSNAIVSSHLSYINCLVTNVNDATFSFGSADAQVNNLIESASSTFINVPGNSFNYSFDYRLKTSSTGSNHSTDGTDNGIYGTNTPFNPNPYNPHIYSKKIGATTNAQGQLQIEVKVKAQ